METDRSQPHVLEYALPQKERRMSRFAMLVAVVIFATNFGVMFEDFTVWLLKKHTLLVVAWMVIGPLLAITAIARCLEPERPKRGMWLALLALFNSLGWWVLGWQDVLWYSYFGDWSGPG